MNRAARLLRWLRRIDPLTGLPGWFIAAAWLALVTLPWWLPALAEWRRVRGLPEREGSTGA